MSEETELITAEEAMRILQIKRTKLYELINAGLLPRPNKTPVKKRAELLFRRSDVEALLNPPKS